MNISPIKKSKVALLLVTAIVPTILGGAHADEPKPSDSSALGWECKVLETAPTARLGTAMAMFEATSELILFGGGSDGKAFCDTWGWDGVKWTEKHPAHQPPETNSHAMAYDPLNKQIVLIGGIQNGEMANSTWLWDGKDWSEAKPETKPQYSVGSAMAFNHANGRVMLYGGTFDDENTFWEWDGQTWIKVTFDMGPPPRSYAGLAFDQERKEMILFGGITNPSEENPKIYNDTWAWNGKAWREIPTATAPSSRYEHKMEYHPVLKSIILVGGHKNEGDQGFGPAGLFNDTWSWDGSNWTEHKSQNVIDPAYSYGMGYNPTTKQFYTCVGDSLICAARGPKVFTLTEESSSSNSR